MTPALLALALLLLILLSVYWQAPRCPRCGCLSYKADNLLPKWRTCSQCHEIYEIRLH